MNFCKCGNANARGKIRRQAARMRIVFGKIGDALLHQRGGPRLIRQAAGNTGAEIHGFLREANFLDAIVAIAQLFGTRQRVAGQPDARKIRLAIGVLGRRRVEIGLAAGQSRDARGRDSETIVPKAERRTTGPGKEIPNQLSDAMHPPRK